LGADGVAIAVVAEARKRAIPVEVVRTGSRGLYWLEPMIEVERAGGRLAYGPVAAGQVVALFDADFLHGGNHPLALGVPGEIPYLARQERLTFDRLGIIDPLSLDDYIEHGGYRGLQRALALSGEQIVEEITLSGLRGRGGAGFPAGIKWRTTLQ